MNLTNKLLLAGAIAFVPAILAAAPPGTPQGTTQGTGTSQVNGPATTGQPNASCEDAGTRPGQSEFAPGSAFNPTGVAGSHYAGEQTQNSRNSASVSQYDVACINQPG